LGALPVSAGASVQGRIFVSPAADLDETLAHRAWAAFTRLP